MPLITIIGAGPGVSQGVAKLWGQNGYTIGLIARNEAKLQTQVQELADLDIRACYATGDATDPASLRKALDQIKQAAGAADVLLYNVSVAPPGFAPRNIIEAETPERVATEFMAGAINAITAVQYVLPDMRAAGKGTLLLTGSSGAFNPSPDYGSLGLQKAGIRNLAQQIHGMLHGKNGLRVGMVTIIGFVDPDSDKHNPDAIAQQFWRIHTGETDEWEVQW